MKANQVTDLLEELKSLRRKVKKSADAQEKVEHQLAQVVTLVKHLYEQLPADPGPQAGQLAGKSKKKSKQTGVHPVETASLTTEAQ